MKDLANAARQEYTRATGLGLESIVTPSIPILYFGDDRRYFESRRKVITVGLNPSCREFPDDCRFRRFPLARELTPAADDPRYLAALRDYFRAEPYDRWFRQSFESILGGLDASYYDGAPNTALHTDLFSPLATDPTWSRLGEDRRHLQEEGVNLWHRLVERLEPDVMIISIARRFLHNVRFHRPEAWRTIHTVERANPFEVEAENVTIAGKTALMVFGTAANIPFGTVSSSDKKNIGRTIAKVLDEQK